MQNFSRFLKLRSYNGGPFLPLNFQQRRREEEEEETHGAK